MLCYRPPPYWGEMTPGTITWLVVTHCRQYCTCEKQEGREEEEEVGSVRVEDHEEAAERRGRPSRRRKWDGTGTEGGAGEGVDRTVGAVQGKGGPVCEARERRYVGQRTRGPFDALAGIESDSWG